MNARRWSFATLVGVVSAAVYAMVPSRGVNLWGLQLIETIDAHRMARAGGDLAAAFAHPSGVFPGVPAVLRLGGEPLTTATLACAVAAGLGVALVFVWASRIAGPIAGGFAALALALSPRWVAAATAPSMTVFAVVAVLGFAVALCAAVRNPRATPWVWVAAIACAQTSLVGWLAFLPGLWVTVAPPQHGVRLGLLTARPVQLGALVAPLVGIGSLLLFVWFWEDTGTRIGNLLEVWMKRPSEAALVAGERIGPVRINAWSPGVLWWQTLPSWVSVCAVGGWVSLRRSSASSHTMAEREAALESTRMVRVYLAAAWLAVVGFGTLHFAGLDLLAFGLPVLAVLAGVFIARALRALPGQTVKVAVALSAAVAVSASGVAEMSRYGGALEAYTPGSRGGVHQAMRDGRASITHPVISPAWAREAQQLANGGTLAILTNAWEARPVLDAYARWGLVDEAWRWAEPRDADVVIVFDDATLPERYAYATDIAGIRADDGPRAEHRVDGVVLYGAYRLTDER